MLRKSIILGPPTVLVPYDKRRCRCIAYCVIIQCVITFMISSTILNCLWNPDHFSHDYYKLTCIMYLFDKTACGYERYSLKAIKNLQLSNDTKNFDVRPIKWMPPTATVSTRLSAQTRLHMEISIAFHTIWLLVAVVLLITSRKNKYPKLVSLSLTTFFYTCIFIIMYDFSMAIVYIADLKQSLTKGMILRYSGWSIELTLNSFDGFGGWIPIAASICWLRGVLIFMHNVYACKILYHIRHKIQKKEIVKRFVEENHSGIPQPKQNLTLDDKVIYFREGDLNPYVKSDFTTKYYE